MSFFKQLVLGPFVGLVIATSPGQSQERECLTDLDQLSVSQLEERDTVCPNKGEILYFLGKAKLREKDFEAASEYFVRGLENPGIAEAELRLALGDVELTRGDYALAATIYEKVADDYPDWELALDYLGFALFATGDYERAKIHLRQSIGIRESAASYRTLTLVEYSLGDWEAAIDALNRGYSLDDQLLADRDFMVAGVRSYTEIARYDVARSLLALLLDARPEMRDDEEFVRAGFYLRERMLQDGLISE